MSVMNTSCPSYENLSKSLPPQAVYEEFHFPDWDKAPLLQLRIFMSIFTMSLTIIGSIANILTLLTLWRYRSLRVSTRMFFSFMAITDAACFPQYGIKFWHVFYYARNYIHDYEYLCSFQFCLMTILTCSSWSCLAVVAIERFLLVYIPQKMRRVNPKKYAVAMLIAVCCLSFFAAARHLGYGISKDCICVYHWPMILIRVTQSFFYLLYIFVIGQVFFSAFSLRRILTKRRIAVEPGKSGESRSQSTMTPVIMTFAVGVFQFLASLPFILWLSKEFILGQNNPLFSKGVDIFIKKTINFIMLTNFGSNFFIYFFSSRSFRASFLSYLPIRKRVEEENSVSYDRGNHETNV